MISLVRECDNRLIREGFRGRRGQNKGNAAIFKLFRSDVATVASLEAFRDFQAREAAHLAQKTVFEYCRARIGFDAYKAMNEEIFAEAMSLCRWEGFAAVLADQTILADYHLRHAVGAGDAGRHDALFGLYRDILLGYPVPAHRADWDDTIEAFGPRLARARAGPLRGPLEVATASGGRLFETLPIHPTLRRNDRELVVNSVRLGMILYWERLTERVDAAAVAAALDAAATPI